MENTAMTSFNELKLLLVLFIETQINSVTSFLCSHQKVNHTKPRGLINITIENKLVKRARSSYLSSQKVHGECKGKVSFPLSFEILSKALSLILWMLCSSRTGLDDGFTWKAATGTAIATLKSERFRLKRIIIIIITRVFFTRSLSLYIRSFGKIKPDQLLTHWSSHRLWQPEQRWRQLTARDTYSEPEVSVPEFFN